MAVYKINQLFPAAIRGAWFWLTSVEALGEADPADGFWLEGGPLRMWHGDGWSPGYFETADDQWVFVPDYEERPS